MRDIGESEPSRLKTVENDVITVRKSIVAVALLVAGVSASIAHAERLEVGYRRAGRGKFEALSLSNGVANDFSLGVRDAGCTRVLFTRVRNSSNSQRIIVTSACLMRLLCW